MRGAAEEAAVIMMDDVCVCVCVYGFYTCSFCLRRRSLNRVQHSFQVTASKVEVAARDVLPPPAAAKVNSFKAKTNVRQNSFLTQFEKLSPERIREEFGSKR